MTGTQSSTKVAAVGGKTAADVAAAVTAVAAATSANTASTLVARDAQGDVAVHDATAHDIDPSGNISFPDASSTATSGSIYKNGILFIHNTGTSNTFVGYHAGESVTGSGNSAMGSRAGGDVTTGQGNTLMGSSAGGAITTGYDNTFVGELAGSSLTTGHDNTFLGEVAGTSLTSGHDNTLLGQMAGGALSSGSHNIVIGSAAGSSLSTGSDNIYIGNSGAAESGVIRIGDGDQTSAFVSGIRGVTTGVADAIPVVIDSDGQLGTVSSSARYKKDIESMGSASDVLYSLRPVTFHYRANREGSRLQYGLIAEEVAKVAPDMVVYENGVPETVLYRFLAPMLLNEVQELHETVQAQGAEIQRLEQLLADSD
ncbi:MAG TPA: tail fiber domain-containing protein [Longimicrobiaceae bacterium]|nr:tail fiber domain-containing protein [Longimicrobiaceae bacterium]